MLGQECEAQLRLTDQVTAQFPIDERRLAIMGESYGRIHGQLVDRSHRPFLRRGSENGIRDMTAMGLGLNGPNFWHLEMGGSPHDRPRLYEDRSPITHVEPIRAPLFPIHAEEDAVCPIEQGESLYAALIALDRDVAFCRVPGEGHLVNVFGRYSSRVWRTKALDSFLREHRLGREIGLTGEQIGIKATPDESGCRGRV